MENDMYPLTKTSEKVVEMIEMFADLQALAPTYM